MNASQLEAWVLDICDRVVQGRPVEDARVELKRELVLARKAARRLAGHCNAAHGELVLWVVGVDEKSRSIVGASTQDLASWIPQVTAEFDMVAPRLIHSLVVPHTDKSVAGLLFDSERAPYLVKIQQDAGAPEHSADYEVPYREGTRVRSARRSELLRLLATNVRLPEVEIISARGHTDAEWIRLFIDLYVVPANHERLVLPFHRCSGSMRNVAEGSSTSLSQIRILPPQVPVVTGARGMGSRNDSLTMHSTQRELMCSGPGAVILSAVGSRLAINSPTEIEYEILLNWTAVLIPSRLIGNLRQTGGKEWA